LTDHRLDCGVYKATLSVENAIADDRNEPVRNDTDGVTKDLVDVVDDVASAEIVEEPEESKPPPVDPLDCEGIESIHED